MSETTDATRYERRDTAAWIHLCRPDKRNALSPAVVDGIAAGLHRAGAEGARSVVITGSGAAFCAGADLTYVLAHLDDATGIASLLQQAGELTCRIEQHPTPVIAAVNGVAVAGGLEIVLACDLVLAAQSASFSDGHANYGLFPGAGSTVRLPRLIGANRARQLMYTGETVSAETMQRFGVVNEVVPEDELETAVSALCERIARGSAAGVTRMKHTIRAAAELSVEDGIALELAQAVEHMASPDVAAGLKAFAARMAGAR